mgnify:CR=1 FL=1
MQRKTFTVSNPGGLHARPAAMLVSLAKNFESQITITQDEATSSLKNPIGVLAMGISRGTEVTVSAKGSDEDLAIQRIAQFFEQELSAL